MSFYGVITTSVLIAVFPGGIKCRSPLFPKILVKKQELIKCFCSTNNQASEWTDIVCGCDTARFSAFLCWYSVKLFHLLPFFFYSLLLICRFSRVSGSLQDMASWLSTHPALNEWKYAERPWVKDLGRPHYASYHITHAHHTSWKTADQITRGHPAVTKTIIL